MKPKTNRRPKNRDIDKDTVVAYHEFIQGRIQDNLNGISIGPGQFIFKISVASAIFAFCCLVVGVLIVALRHRHVYLVDWNAQFLGPFFIILALLFFGFATFLCMLAKQRTNHYRADLAFRPIGDCGVAVVHKSKLNYDDQKKSELKSGTNPHNVRHPGRPNYDSSSRGNYSNVRSYDSRGYKDDYYGEKRRPDDRPPRRDYDRDQRDGRGHDDRPRRPRENGDRPPPPRRPREDGDNRPPRRPREEGDRPPRRPDDRGQRPRDDRGRRPDDRERRPRPPPGSEEEKRREAGRRRYEEEKRRRHEEDRRRAELRKEAEAASYSTVQRGEERGVDVDDTRTFQIQTTVKLSREIQETDESEL